MKKKLTTTQKSWIKRINNQKKSGLSQSQYCERNNIPKSSFSSMKCQLSQSGYISDKNTSPLPQEPSLFISTNQEDTAPSIKIKCSNGLELLFDKVPDSDWMGKVISSIGVENDLDRKL